MGGSVTGCLNCRRSALEQARHDGVGDAEVRGDLAHCHPAVGVCGFDGADALVVGGSFGGARGAVLVGRVAEEFRVVGLDHDGGSVQVLTRRSLCTSVYNMIRAATKGAEMTATVQPTADRTFGNAYRIWLEWGRQLPRDCGGEWEDFIRYLAEQTGGEPISPAASRAIRRYVRRTFAPDLFEASQ